MREAPPLPRPSGSPSRPDRVPEQPARKADEARKTVVSLYDRCRNARIASLFPVRAEVITGADQDLATSPELAIGEITGVSPTARFLWRCDNEAPVYAGRAGAGFDLDVPRVRGASAAARTSPTLQHDRRAPSTRHLRQAQSRLRRIDDGYHQWKQIDDVRRSGTPL